MAIFWPFNSNSGHEPINGYQMAIRLLLIFIDGNLMAMVIDALMAAVHSTSAGQKQKPTSAHDQEIDEAQRFDQEANVEHIDGEPIKINFGSSRHHDTKTTWKRKRGT